MQLPDGSLQKKTRDIMQGGVISPILSNLFLHYVFDAGMARNHPDILWCRYADCTPAQAWNKWGESPLTLIVYSEV
jgi:retron-type reverse transcriptase